MVRIKTNHYFFITCTVHVTRLSEDIRFTPVLHKAQT